MTDFSNWTLDQERDEGVGFLLEHRGVSVVINRNGTPLPAQTVMISPDQQQPQEKDGDAGQGAKQRYIVVGRASLDIRRGDRFSYRPVNANQLNVEVSSVDKSVIDTANMVQARAQVVS